MEYQIEKNKIIKELEKRIDYYFDKSKNSKGKEKKSYEDTCNSFVIFKMWVSKQ